MLRYGQFAPERQVEGAEACARMAKVGGGLPRAACDGLRTSQEVRCSWKTSPTDTEGQGYLGPGGSWGGGRWEGEEIGNRIGLVEGERPVEGARQIARPINLSETMRGTGTELRLASKGRSDRAPCMGESRQTLTTPPQHTHTSTFADRHRV